MEEKQRGGTREGKEIRNKERGHLASRGKTNWEGESLKTIGRNK